MLQSCSALWLNKASQETDSEHESVVMKLYSFQNVNASSIRTLMVANCVDDVTTENNNIPEDASCIDNDYYDDDDDKLNGANMIFEQTSDESLNEEPGLNFGAATNDQNLNHNETMKTQEISIYENGSFKTKLIGLDEDEVRGKMNGTIEYHKNYREVQQQDLAESLESLEVPINELEDDLEVTINELEDDDILMDESSSNSTESRTDPIVNVTLTEPVVQIPLSYENLSYDFKKQMPVPYVKKSNLKTTCNAIDSQSSQHNVHRKRKIYEKKKPFINETIKKEHSKGSWLNGCQSVSDQDIGDPLNINRFQGASALPVENTSKNKKHTQNCCNRQLSDLSDDEQAGLKEINVDDRTDSCEDDCYQGQSIDGSMYGGPLQSNFFPSQNQKYARNCTASSWSDTDQSACSPVNERDINMQCFHTPHQDVCEQNETCPSKYLIFTTGSLTYTPHQIGIKRIDCLEKVEGEKDDSMRLQVKQKHRRNMHIGDSIDTVLDMHGHIIGMCLSPDHR